jgi:NTP pyrophosphatase (non-canonical NTP hydrolase)
MPEAPIDQPVAPFVIGTPTWPGLATLAEECGELLQVIGKLIAFPDGDHPDGGRDLALRLQDELADVWAAVYFTATEADGIDAREVSMRASAKLERFRGWHRGE